MLPRRRFAHRVPIPERRPAAHGLWTTMEDENQTTTPMLVDTRVVDALAEFSSAYDALVQSVQKANNMVWIADKAARDSELALKQLNDAQDKLLAAYAVSK